MEALTILTAILTLLTALCYSYQVFYHLLALVRKPKTFPEAPPRRYAILIAARNEEAVLPHLLESIRAQDYPAEYITTYVIADNCTDQTAAVARRHGAKVFSRFSTTQIGKGYALRCLLQQIRQSGELEEQDAFLVFDADNLLAPDYIRQINRVCAQGYPAFCGYRNSKNFGSNWLSGAYSLWYLHDCGHMNRARMALGLCCYASGTGFGFTRELLEKMRGWNFLTLTEDIEFRTWCATRGIPIGYCQDAVLYDEQPTSLRVSVRQRTRWVQGSLQVATRYLGDLRRGLVRGGKAAWCTFEAITLSPWGYCLSALGLILRLLAVFLGGGWMAVFRSLALSLATAYGAMLFLACLTLLTEGRRIRATGWQRFRAALGFPVYMLSYLPIAVLALFRKYQWQPIAHTLALPASHFQRD